MPAEKDAIPSTMKNNVIEAPTLTDASYADLVREMIARLGEDPDREGSEAHARAR